MQNSYFKYVPNVWLAKTSETFSKGDIIEISTKYGKVNEHEIYNLIASKDGFNYYSIVRVDGMNAQEYAKRKAEKLNGYAANAEKKSNEYYEASNEGKDFLSLGEPIKIGHHSEKRHRALIQRNWDRMGKSVELSEKAEKYEDRAAYWAARTEIVNLSMPESLQYFEFLLVGAKQKHEDLKSGKVAKDHSFSLTYAKKHVNEIEKNIVLAQKLWGDTLEK